MNCKQVLVLLALLTAANKSFAKSGYGPGEQDWGYIDVRKGAHMFYWLYKTTANVDITIQRPLVIWLGGPKSAATGFGNFYELGPLKVNGNTRNSSWVKDMNILFIDGPVGSGFSYVDHEKYFTTNSSETALDLVECLKGFFARHTEFEEVPLHIFTEDYGGKIAPEFALELYYANQRGEIKCNLVSLAMGNPFTSPTDAMLAWAPFLFYTGVIDKNGYNDIMASVSKTVDFVDNRKWSEATTQWGITQSKIKQLSSHVNLDNILKPVEIDDTKKTLLRNSNPQDLLLLPKRKPNILASKDLVLESLMRGPVSKALGIPEYVKWGSQFPILYNHVRDDIMKPAVHFVSEILKNTNVKVGVYSGQLDLGCSSAGSVSWIEKLKWYNSSEYISAPRQPINVNGYLEGYEKSGGNFNMFWVDRAGRFVPSENPAAMSHILKKFTNFG